MKHKWDCEKSQNQFLSIDRKREREMLQDFSVLIRNFYIQSIKKMQNIISVIFCGVCLNKKKSSKSIVKKKGRKEG